MITQEERKKIFAYIEAHPDNDSYFFLSEDLRQDTEVVRYLLLHANPHVYYYISTCVYHSTNIEFFHIACSRDEKNFWYAPDSIKLMYTEKALDLFQRNIIDYRRGVEHKYYRGCCSALHDDFICDDRFFEASLTYHLSEIEKITNIKSLKDLAYKIDQCYEDFISARREIEEDKIELQYFSEYFKNRPSKPNDPQLFELAQFYYAYALEMVGKKLNLSKRLIYEYVRDAKHSLKYLPEEYKNDSSAPESKLQTLPKEFMNLFEEFKETLFPKLLTYNPALTIENVIAFEQDFRAQMKAGMKSLREMIDFLDSCIGGTLRSMIEDQWRQKLNENETDPYDYIQRVGEWKAYDACELATLYPIIFPETIESDVYEEPKPFYHCVNCNLLFHPSKMSMYYWYEEDKHVCLNCEGLVEIEHNPWE